MKCVPYFEVVPVISIHQPSSLKAVGKHFKVFQLPVRRIRTVVEIRGARILGVAADVNHWKLNHEMVTLAMHFESRCHLPLHFSKISGLIMATGRCVFMTLHSWFKDYFSSYQFLRKCKLVGQYICVRGQWNQQLSLGSPMPLAKFTASAKKGGRSFSIRSSSSEQGLPMRVPTSRKGLLSSKFNFLDSSGLNPRVICHTISCEVDDLLSALVPTAPSVLVQTADALCMR